MLRDLSIIKGLASFDSSCLLGGVLLEDLLKLRNDCRFPVAHLSSFSTNNLKLNLQSFNSCMVVNKHPLITFWLTRKRKKKCTLIRKKPCKCVLF